MVTRYLKKILLLTFSVVFSGAALAAQPLQCITDPARVTPCPNLVYTSVKLEKTSRIICYCKSDSQSLLALVNDTESATSRVALRKLLSLHQLTSQQLIYISAK